LTLIVRASAPREMYWLGFSVMEFFKYSGRASAPFPSTRRNTQFRSSWHGISASSIHIRPTPEEEAEINAGIVADPDNPEQTAEDYARMRRASEVMPELAKRICAAGGAP